MLLVTTALVPAGQDAAAGGVLDFPWSPIGLLIALACNRIAGLPTVLVFSISMSVVGPDVV